ncbi:MAG: SPOR domain-containing protein, partial [Porphyrobacter sp.]|nr:SPOR domain-containing protein [Porphyrobacter sp.]
AVQQPASVQPDDTAVPRIAAAVQPPPPQPQPDAATPVLVASIETQPSSAPPPPPVEEAPRPSFSISPPVAAPADPKPEERVSLAEAFADFAAPPPAAARTTDVVDISRIKPVRETARARQPEPPKAKPKPKPPANPSRVWVQVGTGRNVKALDFTWRRLQKQGGRLLAEHDAYSARWGATRRLVTGPYESEDDAQDAIRALKKKGIDAFEFTSDEGEEVSPLS